jgi:hypothetical protein
MVSPLVPILLAFFFRPRRRCNFAAAAPPSLLLVLLLPWSPSLPHTASCFMCFHYRCDVSAQLYPRCSGSRRRYCCRFARASLVARSCWQKHK